MRMLVISNLYPPLHLGGYELGCAEIVNALRAAGHNVTVLTSRHGLAAPRADAHVYRSLEFGPKPADCSGPALLWRTWKDQRTLLRLAAAVKPELIYAFSFYGLSMALLLAAQRLVPPIVYAVSAEWLESDWKGDPWLSRWCGPAGTPLRRSLKQTARRLMDSRIPTGLVPLDLGHAYFTSRRLRDLYVAKGFPVQDAPVIHWGVDSVRFHPPEDTERTDEMQTLFAGRIAKEKGLHTVIEAFAHLHRDEGPQMRLTVAGPAQDTDYLDAVNRRIDACGLRSRVDVVGPVPPDAMPQLYRRHDVLLFPSMWEEPFSIGLLEAMASGLAVVGTTTGGSQEVLVDGSNALTFPPGDAPALAAQLRRLAARDLRQRLGDAARRTVEERFTLAAMLERIQGFLCTAVGGRAAVRPES